MTLAWLLNLDADDELAEPERAIQSKLSAPRLKELGVRTGLVAERDVLLANDARGDGLAGRAWMPTPRALARIREAGAIPPPAPTLEVLTRVNHRAFASSLGIALPGAVFATDVEAVARAVAGPSPTGAWLLKRPLSFAGRGRRRVAQGALDGASRAWIAASLAAQGGLSVDPEVTRTDDFALHGHLDRDATLVLGQPTAQTCDARGVWRGSERVAPGDLTEGEHTSLLAAAHAAAAALTSAGYFGPFGIDAFRYRDEAGATRFLALCEINARYTMGWATGMANHRPDREGPPPGEPAETEP